MSDQQLEKYIAEIDNIYAEYKKLHKELIAKVRQNMTPIFRSLMEKFPEIASVSWRQYTPYFNDGDTCVFSADMAYCKIVLTNNSSQEFDYYDDIDETVFPRHEEFMKFWGKIASVLTNEILLELYGDHAEVTVLRDGSVSIEPCDHD